MRQTTRQKTEPEQPRSESNPPPNPNGLSSLFPFPSSLADDLYNEVAGNLEVLKRVDENAALDTPEAVAALRSVIGALKVASAATILLYTKTLRVGTIRYNLSKALTNIFLLKSIDGLDSSAIIPQTHKPLLEKIRPEKYLADIKYHTERIYTALST